MKYKHIIWDYNGTLLSDVQLCVDVINIMLKQRGLVEVTFEGYKTFFDFPVKNYYAKQGFDFEKESFEKVGTEFITRYNKMLRTNAKLHENTKLILQKIYDSNILQSVLSARKQKELKAELEFFGIKNYFQKIVGLNNNYAAGKLENGKILVSELKLNPDEILLVGDTVHDYEVAFETGINTILLSHGHNSIEKLQRCKVPVFSNLQAVWKYISEKY